VHHGASCHRVVFCAVAMFIHGATARRGQKTINLCSVGHHGGVIVAVMMASLVIVFFVEVAVFV